MSIDKEALREDQLVIEHPDGTEELATILFTHEANGKNYVVFEFDETKQVSAAIFTEDENGEGYLEDIETDEEFEMLDVVLDKYYDDLEEELDDENN